MIDFDVLWQPILMVNDPAHLPPHFVAAGQLRIQPPNGQGVEDWWRERIRVGEADHAQGQLEARLLPYVREMQRVRQWHIPLHPQIAPATRDWLPFWNEDSVALNLVYELPVDQPIDDVVWAEIELVRRAPRYGGVEPMVAGTHVGRQGLDPNAAHVLNDAPWRVLLLDPRVSQGLSNVSGDAENDRRFDALGNFLRRLRPDLPVVATGIRTMAEWQAVRALGVLYGQGDLWAPAEPLAASFGDTELTNDPDWFPDKVYPNADDRVATRGLSLAVPRGR